MKNLLHIPLIFFLFIQIPAQSQDDVNLFDYWKYYSDAENSMYKTSCSHAFEQLQERKTAIAQLQTKNDYLKRQETVKEKLLRITGPLPGKTPLNARVTGVIKKKDYKVEKVIYESMPGYYVTAALFLPKKRKGKAPAVIYASGHTANGFRSETYQHIIINLVKKGFVVLAFDPIGQGERLQYYNEKEGKSRFGPTTEHSYPGAQCYISGYSPTKYFIWDGIRSVDYLLTRKEVDPKRIGMTGRSGGGTQTAFTAAMDDRILAAAPECFITSMEYVLKTIGPQDAEQNLFHMISEGIDHADLLEVRAPKPALMVTTTRDFFSIQGARETYKEVKQFYQVLGDGSQINMVEDDDVHASTKKNREAMYAFFQKSLDNPGSPDDLDVEVFEEKELWATETGQLATSLKGETLYSLNKKVVENQRAKLKLLRGKEDFDEHIATVSSEAKQLSGFEYPDNFGKAVFSGRYVKKEYLLEKYLVPGSGDYMLPAALFIPVEKRKNEVVLLLDEQGMEHAANKDSLLVRSILKQGYSVLLFDVPGIGSLGPGYLRGDAYIDNTSFNQWFAGILTNKSIVGMRAEDIVRMVHFLKTDIREIETISALASGATGSEMLHAAVFNENIQKVCLIQPFLSFADIALSHEYSPAYIPSTVAGAIEKYDLPDLMASLCPRKVLVINPLSSDRSPAEESKKTCYLTYPKIVYTQKNVEGNFKHSIVGEGQPVYDKVINWLE
ncbi:MAG: acetylxylan esterase [Cyclobacteriaceae bacterium]|nr:acetylxylan esterase [Cyclobacteriaceae bacterium]